MNELLVKEKVVEYFSKLLENKYEKNQEVPKFTDFFSPSYVKPSNNDKGFRLLDSVNGSSVRGYYHFDYSYFMDNFEYYEQIVLIHHIDMDGELSADNMLELQSALGYDQRIVTIPYNYKADDNILTKKEINYTLNTLIVIVDLSIPTVLLQSLSSLGDILIIDHHATSIDFVSNIKYDNIENNIQWIIDTRVSAAYLTEAFSLYIRDKLGIVLKSDDTNGLLLSIIVSAYDTFNKNQYALVYYTFGVYLNQYFNDMNMMNTYTDYWHNMKRLDEQSFMVIINNGKKLYDIQKEKNKLLYTSDYVYRYNYKDTALSFLVGYGNSLRFCDYNTSVMGLLKIEDDNKYVLSLYSEDDKIKEFNLGRFLSEYFGGGGHPGAAGAIINKSDIVIKFIEYCKSHEGEEVFTHICEENLIPTNEKHPRFDSVIAFITRAISIMIMTDILSHEE